MKQNTEYRKLGFNKEEMNALVGQMNTLLCNLQIHYQKLRNYHWNVTGSDFFDLHERFEVEYNAVKQEIDDIAERIRTFGKKPVSTLAEYLEYAEIKETKASLSGDEMVKEILSDFQILFSMMVEVIETASKVGDIATDDMVTSFLKRKEKQHWMLHAFITKQEVSNPTIVN